MTLKYEVVIFWSNEDCVFVAFTPELTGCMAHGDTREEALHNIQEAIGHWIDIARETGKPTPQPKGERLEFWPDVAGKSAGSTAVA